MNDLIKKKEVIERAEGCTFTDESMKKMWMYWLKYCLEVPAEPQWIPCSERLPKEKGWYQCTCRDNEIWNTDGIVRDLYWYPSLEEFVDNIRYERNDLKEIEKFFWTKYVVAWMPLPEPYKGE